MCTKCLFCDEVETTDHLFVTCSFINTFWQWIARYKNFTFEGNTFDDIWNLDNDVPLKNKSVLEAVRGAVMWVVWLERNRICLENGKVRSLKSLGLHMINLASFWCKNKGKTNILKLSLVLPQDVVDLPLQGLGVEKEAEVPSLDMDLVEDMVPVENLEGLMEVDQEVMDLDSPTLGKRIDEDLSCYSESSSD